MGIEKCFPDDPQAHNWDVVVVGTGPGGAVAGFNLARMGRSVLFLERGSMLAGAMQPGCTDLLLRVPGTVEYEGSLCEPTKVTPTDDAGAAILVGTGIGGSSSIFDMVMDRFRPIDLEPARHVQIPALSTCPNAWPVNYEEMEPYYRDAEVLFRIRGTDDPLTSPYGTLMEPPPCSEVENVISEDLTRRGLHPYRLHYARENVPGCTGCQGVLCHKRCRNDAGRICVLPALERHSAKILPNCSVVKLHANQRSVQSALCYHNGKFIEIRGRVFVLALNALLTPGLLLRSTSNKFPTGLGNQSGMVGRNLMLHVSDLLSVEFSEFSGPLNGRLGHGLSLNDFYVYDGVKLGNIHAHSFDSHSVKTASSGTISFRTIVEDFPYADNRVTPKAGSDHEVCWTYRYPSELKARGQMLIDAFVGAFTHERKVVLTRPSGRLNPAHTCGTCRFGDDPRCSVLDRHNRIHDLDNTYVLDASFFPSSAGINPSLTIAANSLRVSDIIARA